MKTYISNPGLGRMNVNDDYSSLWIWTRNCVKGTKPLSVGLRLLATFVLVTVAIEMFIFITSTGYYLYTGRSDRVLTFLDEVQGDLTVTQSSAEAQPTSPKKYILTKEDIIGNFSEYLENFCRRKPVIMEKHLPACPCISPLLQGETPIETKRIPTIGELELNLTEIQDGGYFRPTNCSPRHHVAIIVPFRDREEHLRIFLNHMHPFLQRQLIEYRIFVVEEVPHKVFNKAMMMNIGFIEARKIFNADCVIFHDVDMIPMDDRNLYACMELPRHLGAFCNKWNFTLPYYGLFGGAISLTPVQFIRVNGYSNEYFGWGGEDDDMFQRVRARKINITRFPQLVSKYKMLKHGRDRGNPYNQMSYKGFHARPKHYTKDGLKTLEYELKTIENRPLYTWIQADIEIPAYIQRQIKRASGQVRLAATGGAISWIVVFQIIVMFCQYLSFGLR